MAKPSRASKWQRISRDVLLAMDIEAEYRELGLAIPDGVQPSVDGWLRCWARDRPRGNTPSAAINVGDGAARGRYYDHGGSGESLTFWDFAAKYQNGQGWAGWNDARRHYAQKYTVKGLPRDDEVRDQDKLGINPGPIEPLLVKAFCDRHKGVTFEALKLCGAKLADYPANSRMPQKVVCLNAYGPGGIEYGAVGGVFMRSDGHEMDIYRGPQAPPLRRKKSNWGSSGLVGEHALKNLPKAELVFKVEGISDLLALQAIIPEADRDRHVVLTNLCGANEKALYADWVADALAGKDVVIIHDCDVPGQGGASVLAGLLMGQAARIRNLLLPYPVEQKHGRDLRDWINAGHNYSQLMSLVNGTEPQPGPDQSPAGKMQGLAEMAPVSPPEHLLRNCGADVMRYDAETGRVYLFALQDGSFTHIAASHMSRFSYEECAMMFGDQFLGSVAHPNEFPVPTEKYTMNDFRMALSKTAHHRKVKDEDVLGPGIWEVDDRVLMVMGHEAIAWDDAGKMEYTRSPHYHGKTIEYGTSNDWPDKEQILGHLRLAEDPDWCMQTMAEAVQLFGLWDNWANKTSPYLVSALYCCSLIQTIWKWRPLIFVTGTTNTGKSTLQETLHTMMGPLSLACSGTTEAGLRQHIRRSARVPLVDEFERSKEKAKILESFRTSSRGGEAYRGTSDQSGRKFSIKAVPWFFGISPGLDWAADKNRFIIMELKELPMGKKRMVLPPENELVALGLKLLALSIKHARPSLALCEAIVGHGEYTSDIRMVESYATPVALLASVMGLDEAGAVAYLEEVLADHNKVEARDSDEDDFMEALMGATVRMDRGQVRTVSQLLSATPAEILELSEMPGEALARVGIRKVPPYRLGDKERVFFVPQAVDSNLLSGTRFEGMAKDILPRVHNGEKSAQRLCGRLARGIIIPLDGLILGPEVFGETGFF